MPAKSEPANLSVGQYAERIRREMIPLRKPFSYYFADLPLTEEDIRILSGQTEKIITKDQTYLTELAVAVRGRLARQPAREAEPVAN